jgi:hypothetical protein
VLKMWHGSPLQKRSVSWSPGFIDSQLSMFGDFGSDLRGQALLARVQRANRIEQFRVAMVVVETARRRQPFGRLQLSSGENREGNADKLQFSS